MRNRGIDEQSLFERVTRGTCELTGYLAGAAIFASGVNEIDGAATDSKAILPILAGATLMLISQAAHVERVDHPQSVIS